MAEVLCGERPSRPPGLTPVPGPAARVLRLSAPALPPALASPGLAEAAAAMDRLRATAARTLREHLNARGTCAGCRRAWPCDAAHLAASALGAG
jgi:hypothetical protein